MLRLRSLTQLSRRFFSTSAQSSVDYLKHLRNIGISAHIDSGKTTLTERILFYGGKIHEIHEVRGKDKVGAKMDHMELEREKGITIQSAATHLTWNNHHINIIDTPGHVDFTIEVERALRVLDGAILVLCAVSGVQSQSITVDRQMRRYGVPRLCFINKLDRLGANPWKVIEDLRKMLGLNPVPLQLPIGLEGELQGVVDLVTRQAIYYDGSNGEVLRKESIPKDLVPLAEEKRKFLIEKLADIDESIGELFLEEKEPSIEQLRAAIRKGCLSLKIHPVFMGSAYRNKGVQNVLDGVVHYLPNPMEVKNYALDQEKKEEKVPLQCDITKPFVGLAFKLEEGKFGQLTYLRVYQGLLKKSDTIYNPVDRKKVKVPRLVRMHADEMTDINEIGAGDIAALFGVDCHSGTTFSTPGLRYTMSSMHVPDPVISMAISPKDPKENIKFSKALNRFLKEDPTFRLHQDNETQQSIISGMGELHLEIYAERIRREYNVAVNIGKPEVNYRETITEKAEFNYTHKKQSGGAGQFGRLKGYMEPLPADYPSRFELVNKMVGNDVPPEFIPAIEKGFDEAIVKGFWCGYPVQGVRVVLLEGASHAVDSNELAFRNCAMGAFRDAFSRAGPQLLEPLMKVEVEIPSQFQQNVVGGLLQRRGNVNSINNREYGSTVIDADVPLENMFGYSTDLRSQTEGKGEFSMEYKIHSACSSATQSAVQQKYRAKQLQPKS